ncbi:hypothetical protein AUJ61_00550 [Candidatus Pacearchaeota archaeon CG1_02_30_18]|nr:hypothetical protein [Candidatus Pacearchaeota archaeon]OIO40935.1 MAG: hypothetical protein AUJ61_00550 [Candidatus Pacearchaeota archaeon CG1_02_30_18]PIN71704.1 MAG: hypothetical protein COV77_00350 [Candidatus Pacearchaeota archaeon CG11_big_fil_rev_8_21_14_0_20_30_13]PIZ81803.1 MAG: hypothetical protein COX98_02200 [Candidatus Pacearchaeota archaeon CG_4_10_14_0_2_um_filter_30_11]PJA71154.1 MAG: hypothetical protein CO153_03000 [Candidatus Pacearchaeota archaeon CG_4_9_14_3_um_filter_30
MGLKQSVISLSVIFLLVLPMVSAGIGLKWEQESALIPEDSNVCLTYGVYNPWPSDSYVQIGLSDSLQEIVDSTDVKVESIPKYTFSNSSIPIKFCFKTPSVYNQDCLVFGKFLCKQECSEEMKIYSGEVEVFEVNEATVLSGGSGGSATSMSISAPLRVKVKCIAHSRNYSLVYALVGIIALLVLLWKIYKKNIKKNKK